MAEIFGMTYLAKIANKPITNLFMSKQWKHSKNTIVESIFFSSFYCWWIKTSEILFEYLRSIKAYGFLLSSSIFKWHWGNRLQLNSNAFEMRGKRKQNQKAFTREYLKKESLFYPIFFLDGHIDRLLLLSSNLFSTLSYIPSAFFLFQKIKG